MPRAKKNLSAVLDAVEDSVVVEKQDHYTTKVEESSDITHGVDTYEKLTDNLNCALAHAESEIARIDERAEIAIQVVTQSIRTQAAVAKGKLLLDIREKYAHIPGFTKSLEEFSKRIGAPPTTLRNWMAAATSVAKHENVFGTEFLMEQSASSLSKMHSLPDKVQTAILEDSVEDGKLPSHSQLKEIANTTSVKIMSAEEKLEEALAKRKTAEEDWELVKADPDIKSSDEEYKHMRASLNVANNSVDTYRQQIEQLKSDLVGEKAKAESAKKAQEQLNKEIESLKFDDTAAKEQRIKRISATLTINIPQILSDVMKFVAEEHEYQDTYKTAIREQMVQLHTFLGEHV